MAVLRRDSVVLRIGRRMRQARRLARRTPIARRGQAQAPAMFAHRVTEITRRSHARLLRATTATVRTAAEAAPTSHPPARILHRAATIRRRLVRTRHRLVPTRRRPGLTRRHPGPTLHRAAATLRQRVLIPHRAADTRHPAIAPAAGAGAITAAEVPATVAVAADHRMAAAVLAAPTATRFNCRV